MTEIKKELKKLGLDEDYIKNKILNDKFEIENPKFSYDINPLKLGTGARTNQYHLQIKLKDGQVIDSFVKDYFNWGKQRNISGKAPKDMLLAVNEVEYLEKLPGYGARVPELYGILDTADEDGKFHHMILMEKYSHTLEEELIKKRKMIQEAETEETKSALRNETMNWLRRVIDVYNVDNYVLNKNRTDLPEIPEYSADDFMFDIRIYVSSILDFVYPNRDEERKWSERHNYSNIMRSLESYVAGILGDEKEITLFNPYPAHILIKDKPNIQDSDYDPHDITKALSRKFEKSDPYEGIAMGDLSKVSSAPTSIGLAALLNHPSVGAVLDTENINRLVEHSLVGKKRLDEEKDLHLEDINPDERTKYFQQYNAGARLAIIRNIYYISSLCSVDEERHKELIEANPDKLALNVKKAFAYNINNMKKLGDQNQSFKELNAGLDAILKKVEEHY
ncbi:hypothetical protein GF361_00460 [Candidatus Woesearchaeota archaeon]|nr:hypothetical protein [Candidatus Woesearchaeota archaeon]